MNEVLLARVSRFSDVVFCWLLCETACRVPDLRHTPKFKAVHKVTKPDPVPYAGETAEIKD
jgi:hypothetical protein